MSGQHKIFSAIEHCLTEDQLLLYLQNKLSAFEQHHVEKHLLDCELCTDALEGLRMTTSKNLSETFAELSQQIDKRVKQEGKKIVPLYPWLRIAAVFVLIAVSASTFIYLQKEQKQEEKIVAEKKPDFPPAAQNNFELKATEPVPAEKLKEVDSKNLIGNKTPLTLSQKNNEYNPASGEIKTNDVSASTVAAVTEENLNREAAPEVVIEQPAPIAVQENKPENMSENAGTIVKSNSDLKKLEAAYAKKEKVDNQKQLSNSAFIINNAKLQIQNNQFDSANLLLDEVINNNDTQFMEEALWNKSIALEKLNRREDAKIVLQKIVTINGKYKKQAKEKLKVW